MKFKKLLSKIVLWFLGRGFEVLAKVDNRVREEVSEWKEGTSVKLKVNPNGPSMFVRKTGGKIKYLGNKDSDADISINFKNIEGAVQLLTGQTGIHNAFAEHRFTVKGDIFFVMSVVRCMYIVEAYLFPKFIAKKVLKEIPKKRVSSISIYLKVIFSF